MKCSTEKHMTSLRLNVDVVTLTMYKNRLLKC